MAALTQSLEVTDDQCRNLLLDRRDLPRGNRGDARRVGAGGGNRGDRARDRWIRRGCCLDRLNRAKRETAKTTSEAIPPTHPIWRMDQV
jgi:hypothetical protein